MLLDYEFKNWRSFRSKTFFSMKATRERDPLSRLAVDHSFSGRILPISAIYGYNASGKTNFVDSLVFLKRLVIDRNSKIQLQQFAFVNRDETKESNFFISFLSSSKCYSYKVVLNINEILYEKLSVLGKNSENVLFEREKNQLVYLNNSYNKDENRLKIIMQGTAPLQTFLNNSYTQQVDLFKDAFEWFQKKLVIVKPNTHYKIPNSLAYSYDEFNELLIKLDTLCVKLVCDISSIFVSYFTFLNVTAFFSFFSKRGCGGKSFFFFLNHF